MVAIPLATRAQNNPATIAMSGGDFEAPVYDRSPFYNYQPANTEWTWSGLAGIQRNGSGLGASNAPSGQQTAFLQGSGTAGNQGAFSGNVTLAAGIYRVTFKAAQRATGNAVPIQIKMDGAAIGGTITPTSTSFVTYASQPFKVSAGSGNRPYRLSFSTTDGSGVSMSLIDTIAVETVPNVNGGSFETPVTTSYGYQPTSSPWNWIAMAGIQHNGSLGANAPEGEQTAFLQGASQPGSFSQNVTLSAGSYVVRFKAAQRSSSSVTPIQVKIDGNSVGAPITPSSPAFADYSSSTFSVGAGNHTVGFSTTSVGGGAYSLIDDVYLSNTASPTVPLAVAVAPSNPSNLVAKAKTGGVELIWIGSSGATIYKVKRATVAGGPYTTLGPDVTGTTYTDSTASNATTYYYRVYAYNAANISDDSNQVVATPLSAPVVTAVAGTKRIDMTWSAVPGATSYRVIITQPLTPGQVTVDVPVNGTSASHIYLNSGTEYRYDVVAYANAVNGVSDATLVSKMTLPDAPLNLRVSNNDDPAYRTSSLILDWDVVRGAASYRVKRSTTNGGPYTTLPSVVYGTRFTDSSLTQGTVYYYRVFAINEGGSGPDSEQALRRTYAPITSAPTNVTATAGTGSVRLDWSAVDNATTYRIKRSTTDGGPYTWITFNYLPDTTYSDIDVNNGTTYYYRVWAYNQLGNGPDSNQVSATPIAPPASAPTNLQAVAGNARVGLSWTAVTSATSYVVYAGTSSNNLSNLTEVGGLSFAHENLTNGTTYYYYVFAKNSSGSGPVSNQVSARPLAPPVPNAPTNLSATPGDTEITLNWNAVNGATSYKIKRSTNGGAYITLPQTVTANTFTNDELTNGTPYSYSVYASNASGDGGDSNIASATPSAPMPPSAPTNLQAVAGSTNVNLTWTAVTGATSYVVYAGTDPNTIAPVAMVTASSFLHEGLTNGTTYYYRVLARNAIGDSALSDQASATPRAFPSAPANLTATAGDGQVTLNWDAISGATGYKVKFSTTNGGPYTTLEQNQTSPFVHTGRTNGTTYYYRVFAINQAGVGPDSDQASATPTAPVTPPPSANRLVDLSIQAITTPPGQREGDNFYFPDEQQVNFTIPNRGTTANPGKTTFQITVTNRGNANDNFRVSGRGDAPGWKVRYFDAFIGGNDVSAQIKSNTYVLTTVPPQGTRELRVEVTPDNTVPVSSGGDNDPGAYSVPVAAYSENASFVRDQVTAKSLAGTGPLPPPAPTYKVDAAVRVASQTTYTGTEVYFPATQTITSAASNSAPAVYNLKVTNKGTVADNFLVKLPVPSGWSVFLYDAIDGGTDKTSIAQNGNGFDIGSLAPSQSRELRIEVKPNVGVTTPLSVNATVTSVGDGNIKDVCTLATNVGTVAVKPVVTFVPADGGEPRACAGGIPNALHQITLTLHASNNGADLGNTAFRLSFENNVGHDSGTTEPLRTARIRRQSDNTWQESLIVTTDSSGNASVTVLSSDVISQLRLIAQPQGQNDIVGGLVCQFEAATSNRGFPDPTVGEYPNWQNDDRGWTCNVSSLVQQGDTVEGKIYIKCKDAAGVLQPVEGHKIKVFIQSAGLGGNDAVYDPDEMLAYLGFIDDLGAVQSSIEVTTAADGSAAFSLKANAGVEMLRKLNFGGEDQSQWGN